MPQFTATSICVAEALQPLILVVEDDLELAQWLADFLQSKGYRVAQCHRGDTVAALLPVLQPDLLLLDGALPGLDGFDLCRQIRPQFSGPVLFLTARDEEVDEILALEFGADDYLTKPVRARVLLARVKALLRREDRIPRPEDRVPQREEGVPQHAGSRLPASPTVLQLRHLRIDKATLSVSLADQDIRLSSKEFELLWLLASQAGQLVSRDFLVQQLRGFDYDGFDRSIDLTISRLRKKLGDDPQQPRRIKTVRGKGYQLVAEAF